MNHIASTGILLFGLDIASNLLPPHLPFQAVPPFQWVVIHWFYGSRKRYSQPQCELRFHINQWLQRQFRLSFEYQRNKCRSTGTNYNIFYYNSGYNPNMSSRKDKVN